MLVTSISAGIGLVLMIPQYYGFLLVGRCFLGLSQGFFNNYYVKMLEEFTTDKNILAQIATKFFINKQLSLMASISFVALLG